MTLLAASTRMYNVTAGATAAWRRLLDRVIEASGVALQIIDHPHPATLSSLWARADLGCAFMCGWPLAQERGGRPVIAAPIPLGEDRPRYHAVFIVQRDSHFETPEQTFGGRFAFNAKGSHSGWNMPQAYLAARGVWFAAEIGPCGPHQQAAETVRAGLADIAAIDSLVWALLCRYDPALTGGLRVVGRTPDQPMPPFVGSAALTEADNTRLRAALAGLAGDTAGRALLADVCLSGFRAAALGDYDETLALPYAPALPHAPPLRPRS